MASDIPLSVAHSLRGSPHIDDFPEQHRRHILYDLSPHENEISNSFLSTDIYTSLEDLLAILAAEDVECVLFGSGVDRQEFDYVNRWVRIFRPDVKLLTPGTSGAAFFSSQRI